MIMAHFAVWVGELCPLPPAAALAELAHRYFEAYAPASPADLASWSGLKMSEVRQAWQSIGGQLVPVENPGRTLWMLKSQLDWVETAQDCSPVVRLLPKFDTYLLGFADRDLLVAPTFAKYIHPGGGLIFQP
ncbi:MAG: winged helix DNA-binding domain-containing protein [Planctomycetes bacterium]|nr:winged helix DNA-binding domain-containing protein [Planctomycetota bacterium]